MIKAHNVNNDCHLGNVTIMKAIAAINPRQIHTSQKLVINSIVTDVPLIERSFSQRIEKADSAKLSKTTKTVEVADSRALKMSFLYALRCETVSISDNDFQFTLKRLVPDDSH